VEAGVSAEAARREESEVSLTKLETPETFFTTQRYVRALLADIERLEGMLAKAAIEITELQQRLESRVEPEAEIARLTRERDEWAAVAAQRNRDRLAAADEPRAPQWDINSIERIARQQGVFGGRDGNTVTITGPIVIDGPSLEPSREPQARVKCGHCGEWADGEFRG
jgi:hypothetical protein